LDRLEKYLEMARTMGLKVHEEKMSCHDGLLIGKDVILREDIPTSAKKTDVLVEEIAHSELTVGNILDQTDSNNRRQEHKARLRAARMRVPLEGLELYREAYGPAAVTGDFVIRFEPRLSVYRVIMIA